MHNVRAQPLLVHISRRLWAGFVECRSVTLWRRQTQGLSPAQIGRQGRQMYRDLGNVTLRDGRNTEPSCVEVSFVADRTGDIAELSACTLSDSIASREVSCVEVAAA